MSRKMPATMSGGNAYVRVSGTSELTRHRMTMLEDDMTTEDVDEVAVLTVVNTERDLSSLR